MARERFTAMARTHVTFQTSRFNTTEPKDYFVNPNCFGDDCARWLACELRAAGVEVDPEPLAEDWGWQLQYKGGVEGASLDIGLIPEEPEAEWLVVVRGHRRAFAGLLRRPAPLLEARLVDAVHAILTEPSAGVRSVRWHDTEAFMQGRSVGYVSPQAG